MEDKPHNPSSPPRPAHLVSMRKVQGPPVTLSWAVVNLVICPSEPKSQHLFPMWVPEVLVLGGSHGWLRRVGHHCPLTVVPHRGSCPITKHCLSSGRRCERPPSGWLKQQVYLLALEAPSQIKCGQAGPLDASRRGLQVALSHHVCLLVCLCGSQSGPLETALSSNVTFRGVCVCGGVLELQYMTSGGTRFSPD